MLFLQIFRVACHWREFVLIVSCKLSNNQYTLHQHTTKKKKKKSIRIESIIKV